MMHSLPLRVSRTLVLFAASSAAFVTAQSDPVPAAPIPAAPAPAAAGSASFGASQQRGVDYLLAHQQDGKFLQKDEPHVGVTALALAAVLTKPADLRNAEENAFVAAATDFLLSQQHDDGAFGEGTTNYQTSAAVLALARLGGERVKAPLQRAQKFLLGVQNSEANGHSSDDKDYGGFGYGPGSRGDVSNTQFAIEALRASGLPAGDEAFRRAVTFMQRTQNLRRVNDYRTEVAEEGSDEKHPVEPGDDGGACYLPGNSKFGFDVIADGVRVPRSYGSMTYALLKTYALCGLSKDDERMQAATGWIRRHWTLATNPGSHAGLDENAEYQGLFYYYETMARALTLCGIDEVETLGDDPETVAWRLQLAAHLEAIQRDDGSWLNVKNGRWWEDQPVMCTIYALLALGDCRHPKAE
ncbi:MAG: terpene cyclase/mutase family protein [Planctomycetes bacterium]|nr:terpene cyclase/mutase family protein [Planctomycetota bacterium]